MLVVYSLKIKKKNKKKKKKKKKINVDLDGRILDNAKPYYPVSTKIQVNHYREMSHHLICKESVE